MLILIGTVPTAYALNRALPDNRVIHFREASLAASNVIDAKAAGYAVIGNPRPAVTSYISSHEINEGTYPSLAALVRDIAKQVESYGSFPKIPANDVGNTRNDMHTPPPPRPFGSSAKTRSSELFSARACQARRLQDRARRLDEIHPALGEDRGRRRARPRHHDRLETHRGDGWRKSIGKTHLTYAQGAAAELVAMGTILAADNYGLPVSTTHVLSSGVAGTMAANGSGLPV